MAMTILLALALQQLDVTPFPAEVGAPVVVRATDAAERPLVGLPVTVDCPDGHRVPVGETDAAGEARYQPRLAGSYCYRTEVGATLLLAPHEVIAPRRQWLYAWVCTPLGLALLWRHLRRYPRCSPGRQQPGRQQPGGSAPAAT